MTTFRWPQGVRSVFFLSINFDAEDYDLKFTTEDRLFGRFSYGRYGVRAGLPRMLALLERRGIRVTFFVTANDGRRHPEQLRSIVAAGHEIAARGLDLTPLPALREKEFDALRQARDVLADITGVQPHGFRAPGGELSPLTLRHLSTLGFTYDSSFQDDDHPYIIETDQVRSIVEIPTVAALDDSLPYSARHTQARVAKIWIEELHELHASSCLMPLTLHLRGDIGTSRAARIEMLDDVLTEIASRPGLRFMNGRELVEATRKSGRKPEGDPFTPHADTLARTPYRGDLAVKPIVS